MSDEEDTPPPTQPPPTDPPAAPPAEPEIPKVDLTEKPTAAEDLISKANTAAARQEKANEELGKLLDRQEAMRVEETLGGKTEAGTGNKEESPADYAKKVLAGEDPNKPTK